MSSFKRTKESEDRVERESDQRSRRTSSSRSVRDNLPKSPSREDTPTDAHRGSTAITSSSSRHLLINSIPGPLVQRVPLTALLPVSVQQRTSSSYRRVSLQNQPDLVNFQSSSSSIRTSGYRGFNSATSELLLFSCVTSRPFSVHLTSEGFSMNSSQPGFNAGNIMGLPQDIPNGYLSQDQSRRQTDFMGNQQVQGMQGGQSAGGGGAAPSISHHHGTSFNFYFVNSGSYGLNFSGNGLPTPTQQPQHQQQLPPLYQGYAGAGPSGMFGSNPFPAHSSQNSSLVANRDSPPSYSSFHSNPFPAPYQHGCNHHQHQQQFGQGLPPMATQPQGPGHYPGNVGGNSGSFQPIPDAVFSDHRAPNVSFNTTRSLSQSTLGDGSLYGDENENENASQQSQGQCNHGGMYGHGPCSQQGYYK